MNKREGVSGLQSNPLEVLFSDMHLSGVTDIANEVPFDFYGDQILNPFESIPQKDIQTLPKAAPQVREISVGSVDKDVKEQDNISRKDKADVVWHFGADKASVQVVISTEVAKGMHPLSVQAKALFEKMLQAIGLQESQVSYIVFNRADKFNQQDKAQADQSLKNVGEGAKFLFVGESSVKCIFDQSLIRARQSDVTYEGKACGLVMHPESLIAEPIMKKLAWQDLLKFSKLQGAL